MSRGAKKYIAAPWAALGLMKSRPRQLQHPEMSVEAGRAFRGPDEGHQFKLMPIPGPPNLKIIFVAQPRNFWKSRGLRVNKTLMSKTAKPKMN